MIESLVLGITQGVAEWLPVSSEGLIALIESNFFSRVDLAGIVQIALFLHMGTFLAALVYFRRDVWEILKNIFRYRKSAPEDRKMINFLFVATLISGGLGFLVVGSLGRLEGVLSSASSITALIGALLLVTAFLQIKKKKGAERGVGDLNIVDGITLGLVQGFAALPGLSRSGLTVSALLLRKVEEKNSLKLSFLLSLPIVLAGNIILNREYFSFSLESLVGLLAAFAFGLLTIHYLLKLAEKVNFGWFVFIFGLLMIAAAFV